MAFFHNLDSDVRVSLGKNLLEKTRDTQDYSATTVQMITHRDSLFAQEARRLFPNLKLGRRGLYSDNVRVAKDPKSGIQFLERTDGSLCSIDASDGLDIFTLYLRLRHSCTNLKRLHVKVLDDTKYVWKQIVELVPRSLEHLELVVNCDEIPNLDTRQRKVLELRSLVLKVSTVKWIEKLDVLLKTFGKTVEQLDIPYRPYFWSFGGTHTQNNIWERLCDLIKKQCPNLKYFYNIGSSTNMPFRLYADLLKHYGPQVRTANLSTLNGKQMCLEVIDKCPNLRISSRCFMLPCDIDELFLLAPILHSTTLYVDCEQFSAEHVPKLQSCIENCNMLVSMDIDIGGQSELNRIHLPVEDTRLIAFSPRLERLTLRISGSGHESILSRIISIAHKLKHLNLRFTGSAAKSETVNLCASAFNLHTLALHSDECSGLTSQRVLIKRETMGNAITTFKRIVNAIKKHPNLQQFAMNEDSYGSILMDTETVAKLREAVQCMRVRPVLLKFGSRSYKFGKYVPNVECSHEETESYLC